MAADKPLTRFLITLCHSSELIARFNSDEREELLREWGLYEHEIFRGGDPTLEQIRAAVAAEHEPEGMGVEVAWWIRVYGPPPRPDWVWGPSADEEEDEPASEEDDGGGGGGHAHA